MYVFNIELSVIRSVSPGLPLPQSE